MPRRIPDYPDAFAGWNYISSMGSLISVVASALFIYIIFNAYTNTEETENKNEVENNPWLITSFFVDTDETKETTPCATTLEFSVISPTPTHVYNVLPILTDLDQKAISRREFLKS